MVDLASIMGRTADTIKPPPTLPTGLYIAQVFKVGELRTVKVSGEERPVLDLSIRIIQALDVELPPTVELPIETRYTCWLDDKSLHQSLQFLGTALGIETGSRPRQNRRLRRPSRRAGRAIVWRICPLGAIFAEAPGKMFRVEMLEKPYTPRGSTEPVMVNNTGKAFPLED